MALVVLADYTEYRAGSTKAMSDSEFPFFERQAEWELNRLTEGLLNTIVVADDVMTITVNDVVYTLVADDVIGCLCELSEYLYKYEGTFNSTQGGLLTSFSNDGQSGSFNTGGINAVAKTREIRGIAKKYLGGSVLLRTGVDMWHG